MFTQAVTGVVETLRTEEKKLSQQKDAASNTVGNLEADVMRVQGAIAALMGQLQVSPKRGRKKGFAPEEIQGLIQRTLEGRGRLTMPKLREALKEVAAEEGRARTGIESQLEQALREGPFRFNGAHWELKLL